MVLVFWSEPTRAMAMRHIQRRPAPLVRHLRAVAPERQPKTSARSGSDRHPRFKTVSVVAECKLTSPSRSTMPPALPRACMAWSLGPPGLGDCRLPSGLARLQRSRQKVPARRRLEL